MKTRTTLTLFVILALVSCSLDGETEPGDLPDPGCISGSGTPAPDFIGLTEDDALQLSDDRNLRAREVGRDGECFPVTMELRDDRVNLEYVDDVVVGAAIY